ncbi:MAG: hypothetical protein K9G41_10110 [Flavobacteriales bacterium]|nr:hypothetical protein [Flavobacteriales bacterium]
MIQVKLTTIAILVSVASLFAQDNRKAGAVHIGAIYDLVGAKADVRVLFIGDAVGADGLDAEKAAEFWKAVSKKADVVAVFSEEMKALAVKNFAGKVFVANDYESYFDHVWESMKHFALIEIKNDDVYGILTTHEQSDIIKPRSERGKPQE